MIEHRAALTTVREINRRWALGADDRALGLSSLSFDLSVWDIFGPLSVGGALVLPRGRRQRAIRRDWAALLTRHRVTVWNSVPALMAMQAEYRLPRGMPAAGDDERRLGAAASWSTGCAIRRPTPRWSRWAARPRRRSGRTRTRSALSIPEWPSIPYGTPLAGQMLHVVNAARRRLPRLGDRRDRDFRQPGSRAAIGAIRRRPRSASASIRRPASGATAPATSDGSGPMAAHAGSEPRSNSSAARISR